MKNLRFKTLLSLVTFVTLGLYSQGRVDISSSEAAAYNIIHLEVDTLPELNLSRTGHTALCLDGQLTVFGGHTDGFIPTQTAEYYQDGTWHTVPLVYPQDHSIIIPLRSGKVFLAGGHHESLGIGQRFSAEIYDPETNTSQGFGCLEQKRAFANAAELADGQIVISGNWHQEDGIEMFENIYDPKCTNAVKVKDVTNGRAKPYILRISDDDAIVFSSLSTCHEPLEPIVIDRLKGESYHEPFFDTWIPLASIVAQRSLNQFIGDESEGRYYWLLPVVDTQTKEIAVAKVEGITKDNTKPTFSLLQLAQSLPSYIDGKQVIYSSLICDRQRQKAYLIGDNEEANVFVFSFPYNSDEPAPLTIYQTAPQPIRSHLVTPMLTPEGDLVFAGGSLDNNFIPSKAVFRLPLGRGNTSETEDIQIAVTENTNIWWVLIVFLCIIGLLDVILSYKQSRKRSRNIVIKVPSTEEALVSGDAIPDISANNTSNNNGDQQEVPEEESSEEDNGADQTTEDENGPNDPQEDRAEPRAEVLTSLFKSIEQLMEQDQLFLNPNLKTQDVANRLQSNVSYVSAAINSQRGCSFTQFITSYRIPYAQKLMLQQPEDKLTTIINLSGFTTESTFFRAFRSVTGMSPKEWLATTREASTDES